MATSHEIFEVLSGVHTGLGWAVLVGFEKIRIRVRSYADGRPFTVCMLADGYEMEITGRGNDDKSALGWTSETWIYVDDSEDTVRAAAVVASEDLAAQAETVWSGLAA